MKKPTEVHDKPVQHKTLLICALFTVVGSIIWLILSQGFEPFISLIAGIAGLVVYTRRVSPIVDTIFSIILVIGFSAGIIFVLNKQPNISQGSRQNDIKTPMPVKSTMTPSIEPQTPTIDIPFGELAFDWTPPPIAMYKLPPEIHIEATLSPNEIIERCDWLQENFPQSEEIISFKLQVPEEQIILGYLDCPDGSSVVNRVSIIGYCEENESGKCVDRLFTLQVSEKGCIDVKNYERTFVSGEKEYIGDIIRVTSGEVTSSAMVYWPWCDGFRP
jgi:hypothetical protein